MRKLLFFIVTGVVGILFLGRMFYLQVLDPSFAIISERNAVKREYQYPQRGYIYDRKDRLMVANQPTYDVMVIPQEVEKFDTLEFSDYLKISPEQLRDQLKKAKIYSPRLPSVILHQVSKQDYAYLQEKMRKFPGFYIQKRALRDYEFNGAANVLGYISQVNDEDIKTSSYYEPGDLIGRSGVEQQYEDLLKGRKGVHFYQRDRFSEKIGPYKNGQFDTVAKNGKDLTLTIDMELQDYGQKLMKGKRGAIVAIEPSSGEILSLVTAPSYDPDLLVGRKRSKNFTRMWYDTINRPLLDRSLLATYAPGSTFKPVVGAIALQEGVVESDSRMACHSGFYYGRSGHMSCSVHPSPLSIDKAIAYSCNTFFAKSYWWTLDNYDTPQKGMNAWHDYLKNFGLGDFLGYDLPTGRPGAVPDADFYNKWYQYPKYKWSATYTLSNGIGQGEVLATPMQLANMTAAIANRGWYYKPHILKKVEDENIKDEEYNKKNYTGIDEENFEPIIQGMNEVYKFGTAYQSRIKGVESAGKTGTVENFTRINGKRTQLTDHSLFISFAPKDNPKIAMAVFVENGRWGSRYASKIAGLMMAKYLGEEVEDSNIEEWIIEHGLEKEYAKEISGMDFKINVD